MKTQKFLLTLIVVYLFTACQPGNSLEVETTNQPALNMISATKVPTSKPMVGSEPNLNNEHSFFKRQCLTRLNNSPEENKLTGDLILVEKFNSGKYFMFDLSNMKEKIFMEGHNPIWDLTISPNRQFLYYVDCSNNSCKKVISTLTDEIKQFPNPVEWLTSKWLDDERLIFVQAGDPPDNTLRIVNPLTDEDTTVSLDIPNPSYFLHPNGKYYLVVSVNKDLNRAIFFDTYKQGRIVLWDLKSKEVLASLPYLIPEDPARSPAAPFFYGWSPDEKEFITTSPMSISNATGEIIAEELFSIGQNGKVTQLTHLSDYYKYVRISEPSWSPDGIFIAFWLQVSDDVNQTRDSLPQQLVILNNKTGEITDYCLPHGEPKYSVVLRPIWSPNGEFLVVRTRDLGGISQTNLVDLEENNLYALASNRIPLGWAVAP